MRINLLSPQLANRVWLILLWLSPLAFFVGLALYRQHNAEMQVPFHLDRWQAIARARAFAASKGLDVAEWEAICKTQENNSLYFYYRLKGEAVAAPLRPLVGPAAVRVLLSEPQRKQNLEVVLAPDGHVLSYKRNFVEVKDETETPEAVPHAAAEAAWRAHPEAAFSTTVQPTRTEERSSGALVRTYSWRWKAPQAPELEGKTTIAVRGQQVMAEETTAELETKYAESLFGKSKAPIIVAGVIYGVLALIVVIFGIFRFTARLRQKEVSYARLFVIALGMTAAFGGFMFQTDVGVYDASLDLRLGGLAYLNNIFGLLTWGIIGLLLGFAYCSGEGDLRELYPGKLTSLDALLTGKLNARNVAQAILHGTALSGWLLLLSQLAVAAFDARPGVGWRIVSQEPFLAHFPWLAILMSWPAFGVLSVLFTLLLPLPLLQRRLQNRRVILLFLFLLAAEATVITNIQSVRPWPLAALLTLFAATAMLLAFFRFDMLTAIITLSSAELVCAALLFLSQPAPELHKAGIIIAVFVGLALALAFYFYFRGRLYHEDEVRPRYASNLAERLLLQAEVSAAREAQIRLLPDKLPEVRQLSVAAVCQPAHEVGGDFYDLFELEPGKLGIFMAEGGGRGLAAALTIAFAKGFLMPKIKSDTLSDNSPTEIVRSLQTQFIRTMAQDEAMSFVYAVIDSDDKTLRYAGMGDFPRPTIRTEERQHQAEEHQIKFQLDHEKSFQITEGIYYLAEGDTVALLSDSTAQLVREEKQQQMFWKKIHERSDSSYRMRDALYDALREGHRRQPDINDDLTAVIVHMKETGETL
jgi:serine phosphatase RsbU (regulator of sigma subunit)